MNHAGFRFYAQLKDFLAPERARNGVEHRFDGNPAIKDVIEALGIPHTEVKRIVVNGETVDFTYRLQDADRVSVYPAFSSADFRDSFNDGSDGEPRFILDVHLGKLASYLRLLGFDTLYENNYDDPDLARISSDEGRILLTRDLGLLKRSLVTQGYFVRNTDPPQQLVEVMRHYQLSQAPRPFHRCLNCNGLLAVVDKAVIVDRLPPRTRLHFDEFHICQSCQKLYWKGSHFQNLQAFLERILSSV